MADTLIADLTLDLPFAEAEAHRKFTARGITAGIGGRWPSSHFMRIDRSTKAVGQLQSETEWVSDPIQVEAIESATYICEVDEGCHGGR